MEEGEKEMGEKVREKKRNHSEGEEAKKGKARCAREKKIGI